MAQKVVGVPDEDWVYVVLHDLVLRADATTVASLMTEVQSIHSAIGQPCPADPGDAALSLRDVARTLWLEDDLDEDELDRRTHLGRTLYRKFVNELSESLRRELPPGWSFDPRFNRVAAGFAVLDRLAYFGQLYGDPQRALRESVDAMYRHLRVYPPERQSLAVSGLDTICSLVIHPTATSRSRDMDPRHMRVWHSLATLFENHGPDQLKAAEAAWSARAYAAFGGSGEDDDDFLD